MDVAVAARVMPVRDPGEGCAPPAPPVPPLRIVHVITGLLSGGAEATLVQVALRGRRHGVEPVVVSLLEGGTNAEVLRAAGVEVIELGLRRSWSSLADLPRLMRLLRLGRGLRADVVQGWMYHGNLAASLIARVAPTRPPVAWNIRQTLQRIGHEISRTRLVIRASARLVPWPDAIVYNLAEAAEDHERLLGYPPALRVLIANGFDCEAFRPDPAARAAVRRCWGVPDGALLLARVGRWHPMKDTPTLLEGFARLASTDARLRLALVGRGMEAGNTELAALIARHGLGGRVLPRGEEREMARIMPAFDLVLSSSSHAEGVPNVVGEAMACGVPVVATDIGASRALVGDPARIVPPMDPAALAAAAARVLALPAAARSALGAADRRRVQECFGADDAAAAYVALWRRQVARAGLR